MLFLIVDNSEATRRTIVHILNALSPLIKYKEVQNGKQALKAMTKEAFDFIITDLEMEGGTGEVFIHHLRSSKILQKKPIIIYSSKFYEEDLSDNIVYLNKGITDIRELGKIIKELIFKYKICPNCEEAKNGEVCSEVCFYSSLDPKWQDKINDLLN